MCLGELIKMTDVNSRKLSAREMLTRYKMRVNNALDSDRTRTGVDCSSEVGMALETCVEFAANDANDGFNCVFELIGRIENDVSTRTGKKIVLTDIKAIGYALNRIARDEGTKQELCSYLKQLQRGAY